MLATAVFAALSLTWALEAPEAALPDHDRLVGAARERLQRRVNQAADAGLPIELLMSKIREGLAKGVPTDRIEAAVNRLADHLKSAHIYLSARGAAPSPLLVRAVAEAKMAGVRPEMIDGLVAGGTGDSRRAVEVLTELVLRAYPEQEAAAVVRDMLVRDPAALERVPGALEMIRRDQVLSHVEAVEVLAKALSQSKTLQAASERIAAETLASSEKEAGASADRQDSESTGKGAGAAGATARGKSKKSGRRGPATRR